MHWMVAVLAAMTLAACGGGGGAPFTGSGTAGAGITLSLLNAQGVASNTVSSAAPLTVRAQLVDKNHAALANTVVTFTTDGTLAVFSPASGTALTDSAGIATITLTPLNASVGGAAKVTATASASGATVTADIGYSVSATGNSAGAAITLSLQTAGGASSNFLSNATPLTAKSVVLDKNGKPVANALVSFGTNNALATLAPSSGTALTDASGVASVVLHPLSLAASGAAALTATAVVDGVTITSSANYSIGATALTLSPLRLTFADASAGPNLPAYGSMSVAVDVLAGGAPFTDPLSVSFSSACVAAGKATLAATVPTSNGTAQAVYRDLGCASTDTISASVTGASAASSKSIVTDTPAPASIQFVSATPSDNSIVIKGAGGVGRSETATLQFKVVDIFGNPLPKQTVIFLVVSSSPVTLNKQSDQSDTSGLVTTTVNSGSLPTTFRVRALVGTASTMSDSITVTTGAPVQKALSLSVSSFNIEGWTVDNSPSTVNVLLADQSGNPVADGAPVVFQTNLGAVGSSAKGGCNTVNGGCSVAFRSQNPRVATSATNTTPCNTGSTGGADVLRPGLATICASTTDSNGTIFGKVRLFMSGSSADLVYQDGATTPLSGVTSLGTITSRTSKVFLLQVNDVNGNPMPAGTTVAITDTFNVAAIGVSPATVPSVAPSATLGVSGAAGSNHAVTIGPSIGSAINGTCNGGQTYNGNFNITITTPLGHSTAYQFSIAVVCQ